MKFNKAGS
jgi:ATP phosphoribosyltransferase